MSAREKPRILCVSRSSPQLEAMCSAFLSHDYEVLSASTPQQAVAICLGNNVSAVVLDSEFFTENGWSAAQTFKMVKPRLPIVLLEKDHDGMTPKGVDAVATTYTHAEYKLKSLLRPAM
jgi:DNA-binding response OmpR family regulator